MLQPALANGLVGGAEAYEGLPEFDYPFHDKSIIVTTCGRS